MYVIAERPGDFFGIFIFCDWHKLWAFNDSSMKTCKLATYKEKWTNTGKIFKFINIKNCMIIFNWTRQWTCT